MLYTDNYLNKPSLTDELDHGLLVHVRSGLKQHDDGDAEHDDGDVLTEDDALVHLEPAAEKEH